MVVEITGGGSVVVRAGGDALNSVPFASLIEALRINLIGDFFPYCTLAPAIATPVSKMSANAQTTNIGSSWAGLWRTVTGHSLSIYNTAHLHTFR